MEPKAIPIEIERSFQNTDPGFDGGGYTDIVAETDEVDDLADTASQKYQKLQE